MKVQVFLSLFYYGASWEVGGRGSGFFVSGTGKGSCTFPLLKVQNRKLLGGFCVCR